MGYEIYNIMLHGVNQLYDKILEYYVKIDIKFSKFIRFIFI